MGKSKEYIGHILAIIAILIFSFNTNFMKSIMPEQIGAFGLVLARCLVSTVGFWIVGLFSHEAKGESPSRRDVWMIMLAGVMAISGNLLFYLKGLELTGPIDATVLRTLQPIMVIGIAAIFFHEKISRYKIIGICLGIIGTVYVSIAPHHHGVEDSFVGDVLIFIATAFTAIYLVMIRPYTVKYNTVTIMKWMSLSSLIVCIPFGYHSLITAPVFHAETFSWIVWGKIAYSVIVGSMVALFISVLSLRYISAFVKSTYIYLLPITGTLVAIMLKLQYPNWHDPIAFVIILAGFILVNKKPKKSS